MPVVCPFNKDWIVNKPELARIILVLCTTCKTDTNFKIALLHYNLGLGNM